MQKRDCTCHRSARYTHTSSVRANSDKPAPPREDPLTPAARSLANDALLRVDVEQDDARPLQRGEADRIALWRRHHRPRIHAASCPSHPGAAAIYRALEAERIDALGSNRWLGVAQNLDGLRAQELAAPGERFANIRRIAERVRAVFCDREPDAESPPEGIDALLRERLPALRAVLPEADQFARLSGELATALQAHLDAPDVRSLRHSARSQDGDESEAANAAAGDDAANEAVDLDSDDEGDAAERQDGPPDGERTARAESSDEGAELVEDIGDEAPARGTDPSPYALSAEASSYRAFTRDYDEIRHARDLADAVSLARWRSDLDRQIELQGPLVRCLTSRLERVLLARQRREWHYDQDEGQLDVRRLSRILTSPLAPLAFQREAESPFRDTTVTLLIDNSRSMLGRPIKIAAAAADILAQTLERCGVSVEVLGFTTTELHGGRSTEAWERAGRPEQPGRLNDLRHIIYKSADVTYRRARRDLGLMLSRDVLKQNIDGESLLWAHARLQRRSEERRVLMVISDGAPVDTSTLSANPRDYLSRHLRAVIHDIERRSAVELVAIGIGHDVGSFYRRAITVHDARDLAPAMLGELDSLFRRAA